MLGTYEVYILYIVDDFTNALNDTALPFARQSVLLAALSKYLLKMAAAA